MGFFSKIFKGVKKVFKKVGKGIKSVFKKVGKFMGKIGIVGQIALSFLLPGVGALIGKAAGAMMASSSAIVSGAGSFLNAAVNIGSKAGSLVKSVGKGVLDVVGKTVGTAINQIPGAGDFLYKVTSGKIDITQMENFTGPNGIMATAQNAITDVAAKGKDLFSMDTLTKENVFSQQAKISKGLEKYAKPLTEATVEVSPDEFAERITAGESPMQASIPKPEALAEIKAPTSFEEGFALSPDDATARSLSTGQADYFGIQPQQPASLLSAPEVPTLSAEQLASGYEYTATGVTTPPQTLTDKFLGTEVGQTVQAKATEAAGKLTKANVISAIDKTYGQQGEAVSGGSYTSFDIPEMEQFGMAATVADQTQRRINRTQISNFGNTVDPLYTPQSSWGKTLAELTA